MSIQCGNFFDIEEEDYFFGKNTEWDYFNPF